MELPHIPQDDLMDVMEMTSKIETYICTLLRDNDSTVGISALMSGSINAMIAQCKNLEEVLFYRNLFIQILDISIRTIWIQGPEKPLSS